MNEDIVRDLLAEQPGQSVVNALMEFIERDRYLLEVDANERSITHRIALYLQAEFPNLDVDCEYNRDNHEPKELMLPGGEPDSYDTNAQTVYPDIILHRRGTRENHLVIEFKKTTPQINDEKDFIKLIAFKHQFNYQYALFIELETGRRTQGVSRVAWINT